MSRNPEKNAQVREARKQQILDAALSVYIHYGYHGCDMDIVADEAQLAKGLLYYYYKTKRDLFTELFAVMFDKGSALSNALIEETKELNPVEQLMRYSYGFFTANQTDPRMMQFLLRAPFDAVAVFGFDKWIEGSQQSKTHKETVIKMIERCVDHGVITDINISSAANSFWSVFVANLFEYSKMIIGEQKVIDSRNEVFKETIKFCFQGLGIPNELWCSSLENILSENNGGGCHREGI